MGRRSVCGRERGLRPCPPWRGPVTVRVRKTSPRACPASWPTKSNCKSLGLLRSASAKVCTGRRWRKSFSGLLLGRLLKGQASSLLAQEPIPGGRRDGQELGLPLLREHQLPVPLQSFYHPRPCRMKPSTGGIVQHRPQFDGDLHDLRTLKARAALLDLRAGIPHQRRPQRPFLPCERKSHGASFSCGGYAPHSGGRAQR